MKILYTASVLSHICQFHLPVMEMLQKEGHEIHVAAKNNLAEKMDYSLNLQIDTLRFLFKDLQKTEEILKLIRN